MFVKKSSCGRAYLQEGGCSTCNAMYVNLIGRNEYFLEEYMNNVTAIKLRKGCTLTTFTDESFDGDENIIDRETTIVSKTLIKIIDIWSSQEITQNYSFFLQYFNGTIGSYECECNDDLYVPKVNPPRSTSCKIQNKYIFLMNTQKYAVH